MFGSISQWNHLFCQWPYWGNNYWHAFWRTAANFSNLDHNKLFSLKSPMTSFLHLKRSTLKIVFMKERKYSMTEGMMGWILVLTRLFIPNNTNKCFMKSYNRSIKNPIELFVVRDWCFLEKQIMNKQVHLIRLCLYIIKGWSITPINLIWNL